jgi:hypothetical protein
MANRKRARPPAAQQDDHEISELLRQGKEQQKRTLTLIEEAERLAVEQQRIRRQSDDEPRDPSPG